MPPENQWLEDVFPIETVPFLGAVLVFGGVFIVKLKSLDRWIVVSRCFVVRFPARISTGCLEIRPLCL